MAVSRTFPLLMPSSVSMRTAQVFCGVPRYWDLSCVLLLIRRGLSVGGRLGGEALFSRRRSQHTRGQQDWWLPLAALVTCLEWCSSGFSLKSDSFSLPVCCTAWKKVILCSPHLQSEDFIPSPWRQNIYIYSLEFFCMEELSPSSVINLFNHLSTSIRTCRHLLYILGYKPILFYSVAQKFQL